MKKFNVFALAVAVLASAILLALWFVLGFHHVDSPLDLVITILWWLLIVGVGYGIVRTEQQRRERIRTVYVADHEMFNAESGRIDRPTETTALVLAAEETLKGLKYGFSLHRLPEKDERPRYTHVIRTFDYDEDNDEWSGEVLFAGDPQRRPQRFENRSQLAFALAS